MEKRGTSDEKIKEETHTMNELYWIGGFVVIYLLLQLVILPKLGIGT